jgi:hypothetical protein
VVATDTAGVGTGRNVLAATGYGTDKAIFGYGQTPTVTAITNLVSNTGVVATDTAGVGTTRSAPAAAPYGTTGTAIFGYGNNNGAPYYNSTNLVSNTGVVGSDVTGVGTARAALGATSYGTTGLAIFAYGTTGSYVSVSNLVTSAGVVGNDVTGVGTAFNTQLEVGGWIGNTTGTTVGIVSSIANATSLTLTANAGVALSNVAYTFNNAGVPYAIATQQSEIYSANDKIKFLLHSNYKSLDKKMINIFKNLKNELE